MKSFALSADQANLLNNNLFHGNQLPPAYLATELP
jgi:hypothetical protein